MSELQRLKTLRMERGEVSHRAKKRGGGSASRIQLERIKAGSLEAKLFQAGIFIPKIVFLLLTALISASCAYVALFMGAVLAVFTFVAVQFYLLTIYVEERALKRRNKILPHLPAFIDGLASALGTGFNLEAAVIQATESIPVGLLRLELDRVVSGLRLGVSLEDAVLGLKHRIAGKEIISLGVSIVLFKDLGGRMLEPFRRLSSKIREQQIVVAKANRDLVQVRLAFNIILFLSVVAPAILMIVQPDYLTLALSDWLGRVLVQIAIIVQIAALVFFRKTMIFKT